ncbi:hypothetical protein JCM8547_007816 [Rhodosporidiobolus lusitaniae]
MGSLRLPYPPLPASTAALFAPESRRSRKPAVVAALAVTFLFFFSLSSRSSSPPPADPEEAWVAHRRATAKSLFRADWRFDDPPLPRAVHGDNLSFTEYLDYHFPLSMFSSLGDEPYVWITLADRLFAATGAANMDVFVRQLNEERRVKYGGRKKETRLVTLCLDRECVEECDRRGMYAYGGFERTRPEQILKATWPKLASLIEILPRRDVFFVDSDVFFAQDPYPHMEPLIDEGFDIIAQENRALGHFNTGWMFLRRGEKVAEVWQAVYDMDMVEQSRDQVNANTFLGTAQFRFETDDPYSLKANFTSSNGLRVHVLDDRLFRTYHERDVPTVSRHDSVYLHSTCCDDAWVKLFVAKEEGFWSDLDDYYSEPPRLMSIDHLSATQSDLKQLFRILITAAYYTDRAATVPPRAAILDLPSSSPSAVRASYSTFPLSQLADPDPPLGVKVLESSYVEHATAHLLGVSALNATEKRADGWWEGLGSLERERRTTKVVELTRVAELDMRQTPTLLSLLARLRTDSTFSNASHVRLMNYDWPGFQSWRDWQLPGAVEHVGTCHRLEDLPLCDEVCRFEDGDKRIRVDEPWPSFEELEQR